jgi:hypothetical protein
VPREQRQKGERAADRHTETGLRQGTDGDGSGGPGLERRHPRRGGLPSASLKPAFETVWPGPMGSEKLRI